MNVVLAAIDATGAARPVLQTAAGLSRTLQASTRALHVRGEGDPSLAVDLAGEFDVPLAFADPPPVPAIVAAAAAPDVLLVTLALHGLPGRDEPGHTALAVIGQVSKPVVVVPPEQPVRQAPRCVLFPLDGTRRVSAAVRSSILTYVAAGFQAVAVHVFEPSTVPRFLDGPADAAVWVDEFAAKHVADLGVRLEVRVGEPVSTLLRAAEDEDADIIALGWRQDLSAERSRVVRGILARSPRPVALVPFLGEREFED